MDATASFEAEGEDREPDVDGEPPLGSTSGGWLEIMELERDTADDEPDHDNEPDYRRRTIDAETALDDVAGHTPAD